MVTGLLHFAKQDAFMEASKALEQAHELCICLLLTDLSCSAPRRRRRALALPSASLPAGRRRDILWSEPTFVVVLALRAAVTDLVIR